ncbi:DUF1441 family protein [Marinomonas mediterranea]|jgi:Protein of unknown function (DUF1441).|uniref:Terminase small subunit n=1 Tax=Marinomonas mediterranea (strain ATCC 700492 / JCM 21426 / NBRC 103028 / MMB-1) TaxID=717774 RepID=F2K1F9_MARM1|nr:DUF1441 family protein [Marinomonas mediterranea]ADZ91090.1 protein of unknown function DUF1441 [Marinomonas mediterranea MMB-1]WCN13151.1 DUF1441 family protein [Marinomonas mediterranea]WCN17222.1 DUF1441 family protein [Marinomonas mediterranea MMB-1]
MSSKYVFNITELAEAFSLHRDTVRKRLRKAEVSAHTVKGNTAYYHMNVAAPAIISELIVNESVINPDTMTPGERKAWFDSENARVNFEINCGELVPADEVARGYAEFAKAIVNPLDSLPDLLERKAGLNADQAEIVQKQVDSIRENMYLSVVNNGGDLE